MRIKDILKLGGQKQSKDVMTSRVMINTGSESFTEFANKLWDLIVNTDYIRPDVHAVLVKGLTHREASETYDVKESYLKNLVGIEGNRLEEDLGMDVYPYLSGEEELPSKTRIDALNTIAEGLISASEPLHEDLFSRLTFDIQSKRSVRDSHLSDSDFIGVVQNLEFLSKAKMESRLEEAGQYTLGYIVYLLRTDDKYLTEKDKTRKEIIKEVWWL